MITDPAALESMRQNRLTKRIQTLIGIVTGLIADNALPDQEVLFLRTWLTENEDVARVWPGSVIWQRLAQILADGRIEEHERAELLSLLQQLAGADFAEGSTAPEVMQLPLQHDVEVVLPGRVVCHTGMFLYGTRTKCEALTEKAGGLVTPSVTAKVHYLVVGTCVSPDWAHQSYGRKIERAMALKQEGHPIAIVPERSWLRAVVGVK